MPLECPTGCTTGYHEWCPLSSNTSVRNSPTLKHLGVYLVMKGFVEKLKSATCTAGPLNVEIRKQIDFGSERTSEKPSGNCSFNEDMRCSRPNFL